MRKLLALLMGVHECSSPAELRRQYQRLTSALLYAEAEASLEQMRRYEKTRERLNLAYERCKSQLNDARPLHGSVTGSGLLLGELLLDAEVITQEQLDDALQSQDEMKPPLPLGRVLVAKKLISWEQLAYFLRLQDVLQLAPSHPLRLSRQLTELGLASRSELEVASSDCEATGCSMVHAITKRGWIQLRLLSLLTGTADKMDTKLEGLAASVMRGTIMAKSR